MIKEAYCSFEVAELLKEKGFDELCKYLYKNNGERYTLASTCYQNVCDDGECLCPTHQMALAWLRENYDLLIYADISFGKWEGRIKQMHNKDLVEGISFLSIGCFITYEEAIEAALKYSLENLI